MVEVQILPNARLTTIADLRGNVYSSSYSSSDFEWSASRITYSIEAKGYQFERTADQIAAEVGTAVRQIREMLRARNESIANENTSLKQTILQLINARKEKITGDAAKLAERAMGHYVEPSMS